MSKSAIDARVNNQIFRKDWSAVIAVRRDLAQISPVRLVYSATDYLAGQCLVRKASDGLFYRWSAASGGSYDSPCVLMENVPATEVLASPSGTAARAIFSAAGVYKTALTDYDSGFLTQIKGKELTDATAITVVKF